MVTQMTTLTLPHTPDLLRAEFEFERSTNEAVRSANHEFINEQFPEHWTVVYEGGQFAAFDDPQQFLAFLRSLSPFVCDSASAMPPWNAYATESRVSDLTDAELAELGDNHAFWKEHVDQLVADYPHDWIVVYGGGKVATVTDQRELWVLQHSFDPITWKVSVRSSPRKPRSRWLSHGPHRAGGQ